MPADTPQDIRDKLVRHIINNFDVSSVSYWKKEERYTDEALLNADLVYSYIPEFAWHDDDLCVYVGKGQFSEWQKIPIENFLIIDSKGNLFHSEEGLINNCNDWKRKYGKLWVMPVQKPKTQEVDNLLLLLCEF
jgi:hypothetical protein